MKLFAKYFLMLIFLLLILSMVAQAQPMQASQSVNINVKIPHMLEVDEQRSATERYLDVRTNVREFCVRFLDQQARPQPVQYKNKYSNVHCFSFTGSQRLVFNGVDTTWSMLALQSP